MKAAEREAARRRCRELAELAVRSQRRANVVRAVYAVACMAGFLVAQSLARVFVRHERFEWSVVAESAGIFAATTAVAWAGFLAWNRRRRS